jgi:hypothetical protein
MVLNLTRLLQLTSIQFNSGQSSIQSPSTWQTRPYIDEQKNILEERTKSNKLEVKYSENFSR